MNLSGECPVCGAVRDFPADTVSGELVVCRDCGTQLEVRTIAPFTLSEAPHEAEDWGE